MSHPLRLTAIALPLLVSTPALAHTGHGETSSFLAGIAHPLFGLDHLLAMLAVGLWAGLAGGRALWAWPAAFVAGMLGGGALGLAGVQLPLVETVILGSVFLLGLAALTAVKPSAWMGALAVVLLAVTHGNAHGLEAPADGSGLAYAAGFTLATAALHALGALAALQARRAQAAWLARAAGLGILLGGMALAAS